MTEDLTDDDIKHVAWLARIKLESQEEINEYKTTFNDILRYFKKINEIDTEKVRPTFHISRSVNRFREDEIKESLKEDEIMQNVPKRKDKFIVSPRII
ncbi:MAG: Asp-tRNA(Asn)/Glu-tRNA(Gln) amidotransferase subunit GatC [Candidatus Helarchaeota archaeon]